MAVCSPEQFGILFTLHKILHSGGQVVNNITNLQTETNFFLQYRGKSAIIVSVKISDFSKKTD